MKKNNSNQISVIIPCYNVEKYIEKCLDSLTNQLDNYEYEIILVNDCSKDNTKNIIKKYIKNKKNFKFIDNEKNIGAGASRNKAIKEAKYKYISFIDSDDYIDDNFYEEMFKELNKQRADLVTCDINMIYEDDPSIDTLYCCCNFTPSKYNLVNNGLAASPCNKIIKKELLLQYPFPEGIMNEDIASIIPIIVNCNKVSYTSNTKYNYIQHSSSVQNSRLSNKKLDLIKAIDICDERIRDNREYSSLIETIIYNQVICFMLYVPKKEKNIFRRGSFLRKFGSLTKKYSLRRNQFYYNYVNSCNIKTRLYYKITNKLICNGLGYSASLFMGIYDLYKIVRVRKNVIKEDITKEDIIKACIKNQKCRANKTVAVSIPNYNYERFLYQRIYSILNQDYKINELIILDDCSKDNSRELIDDIVDSLKDYINIQKIYNETNSESTFKQWKKSLEVSNSDYLWIAEADDYCDKKMVSSLMKLVEKDEDVTIAYVDTAFMDADGNITLKTIKPEIDIMKTGHWDSNFINDGIEEIKKYAFLNCTIANVSSVIFKKDDYSNTFKELVNYKQVGDYYFYLSVMERGKIAFVNKTLNYYRVHGNNVTSNTKKQLHFEELQRVHNILNKKYKFNNFQKKEIKKRYEFLRKVWNLDEE